MSRAGGGSWARLLLAALPLLTSACLVVPLPSHDPSADAVRSVAAMDASSTRADVLLTLGAPDLVRENQQVFVYTWHDPRLWSLLIIGGYTTARTYTGTVDEEFDFILEFDRSGRLVHREVASAIDLVGARCVSTGLCVAHGDEQQEGLTEEGRIERAGHAAYQQVQSWHDPSWLGEHPGRCGLYVFPAYPLVSAIYLDGRLAGFASSWGFLRLAVSPGTHQVSTFDGQGIGLTCAAGEERFVVQQGPASLLAALPGPLDSVSFDRVPDRKMRFLNTLRD